MRDAALHKRRRTAESATIIYIVATGTGPVLLSLMNDDFTLAR